MPIRRLTKGGRDDQYGGKQDDQSGEEEREMISLRHLGAAGAAIAVVVSSTEAFGQSDATTESVGNVLTVQGDVRCDQFAIGSEIIELTEDEPGADFVLTGPLGQTIEAVVSDGTTLEWQATVPADFVIVRGTTDDDDDDDDDDSSFGHASHVYVFGDDPANFDSDETAPNMSTIRQIRFCYGSHKNRKRFRGVPPVPG
jgi:hypothetical protein